MHRRHAIALGLAASLLVPSVALADGEADRPAFLKLQSHGPIEADPGWRHDAALQRALEEAVTSMGLDPLVRQGRCGVALVDLADPQRPRLADVGGGQMIYAASVPKIAVLYAAFQKRKDGKLAIDQPFRETLTQMCRVSSNQAASAAIQKVGFDYIASVLWQSGLYDPELGGGLWVGKAYGGTNDGWHRDPVANMSHGATAISCARLLTLLGQHRLVDEKASIEMLEILGDPGLNHKFVRGLNSRPSNICRKSGSWREWHGDAALVERDGKRYVAVALMQSTEGQRLLEQIILRLDDCIPSRPEVECTAVPRAAASLSTVLPSGT